jgi:hypothetical protein
VQLVSAVAGKTGVEESGKPEVEEIARGVAPEAIEESESRPDDG